MAMISFQIEQSNQTKLKFVKKDRFFVDDILRECDKYENHTLFWPTDWRRLFIFHAHSAFIHIFALNGWCCCCCVNIEISTNSLWTDHICIRNFAIKVQEHRIRRKKTKKTNINLHFWLNKFETIFPILLV